MGVVLLFGVTGETLAVPSRGGVVTAEDAGGSGAGTCRPPTDGESGEDILD